MDFMTQQNSCLVGYRLCPVGHSETYNNPGMEFVYEPGQLWAEPNIDQAARWMRLLYENPGQRKRIGSAGSATISTHYSSAAAAVARLAQIASDLARSQGHPCQAP